MRDVAQNDELTFRNATYSYAELTEMINTIISYQDDYYNRILNDNSYDIAQDIVDCTLDDMNNKIIVGIKELNQTKIKLFKDNVLDSNAIQFENSDCTPKLNGEVVEESKEVSYQKLDSSIFTESAESFFMIKPGMEIYCDNGYLYSVGFPVYRTITTGKQKGFLTAGHFVNVGSEIYEPYNYDQEIGTVKLRSFGGKYDVSFVALCNDVICSNNIANTTHYLCPSNYEIDYPVYGKNISLYGAETYSSGKIISTNYGYYNKSTNTSFNGMVAADYTCFDGDSGGLVASACTGTENGMNYTKMQEGIHCGNRVLDNGSIIGTYYCSAVNIVN